MSTNDEKYQKAAKKLGQTEVACIPCISGNHSACTGKSVNSEGGYRINCLCKANDPAKHQKGSK